MKLGKREIDVLTCPEGRKDRLVFDDELPGFALRITRDGTKTFLFQYRRGAAVRRLRLGRYGEITPAQARRLAEEARGRVAAGGDPAGERAAVLAAEAETAKASRRQAEADLFTFARLIDRWDAEWLSRRCRPSYRREATRALRVNLAGLAGLPAAQINAATVRRALDALVRPVIASADTAGPPETRGKESPALPVIRGETNARRVRSYGAACYAWAIKEDLLAVNPFAAVRRKGREAARDRVLTNIEIGEVWRAAGTLGWPWGPYFRFLLLTLQRKGETAGLLWTELSPDLALWDLPGCRTKNGKPHLVHLAEPARTILRAVPRIAGSPLAFTTTGLTPISGFSHAKRRLDAAILAARTKRAAETGDGQPPAPMVPWWLHDFRRTGVTALARKGVRWEVADRALNHLQGAIKGIAAVYQRHDFLAEREAALAIWAAHVLAVGEGAEAPGNVVSLRAERG
jgi:integrase